MDFMGEGQSKSLAWVCKRCGAENQGHVFECKGCTHEPVLGRRDYEERRWVESHRREDDDQS